MKEPALPKRLVARTARLVVRPIEASDFPAWLRANRERGPQQNIHDTPQRPEKHLDRGFFRGLLQGQKRLAGLDRLYTFGLFERRGGALVGTVTLFIAMRGPVQMGWLGYSIYNNRWRQGFGREGAEAVIGIAFRKLRLHRVEAGLEPANRASAALARSLGMRREARNRASLWARGRWVDIDVYSLNAEARGIRMKPTVGLRPR